MEQTAGRASVLTAARRATSTTTPVSSGRPWNELSASADRDVLALFVELKRVALALAQLATSATAGS